MTKEGGKNRAGERKLEDEQTALLNLNERTIAVVFRENVCIKSDTSHPLCLGFKLHHLGAQTGPVPTFLPGSQLDNTREELTNSHMLHTQRNPGSSAQLSVLEAESFSSSSSTRDFSAQLVSFPERAIDEGKIENPFLCIKY